MADDNGGYNSTALGGAFGNKLTNYLNTSAPGMSAQTQTGLAQMQNTATGAQGGFDNAWNWTNGLIQSGGLGDAQKLDVGMADDAASDYQSMADAFGTPGGEPGFQTIRNNLSDDVRKSVYSDFGASGMFGSDSSITAASEGLGNALGNLDYQNYQQGVTNRMNALQGQLGASGQAFDQRQTGIGNTQAATAMLPSLYAGQLMPGQTMLDAGSRIEQDQNKDYNRFQELLAAFTGSQNNAGMQEEAPWWQTALGIGGSVAGSFF